MKRIEEIERRLLNWARCMVGGRSGGLGYASVDLTLACAGNDDRTREAIIPKDEDEARITGLAIDALEADERDAVQVFYLAGSGIDGMTRRLNCSRATLYDRVGRAHHKIQSWLSERERAQRDQRARTEALQASARPRDPESFEPFARPAA